MCGIAGWIGGPKATHTEATLASMLQAIAHRGPDGEGMRSFGFGGVGERVFLGHRRLAIIDPQGAHQPMCDPASGLALTFNGEIYNFRELRGELAKLGYSFARDSDTEVLLRAYQHWGEDVVDHLRGMFAFVVWDARNERLFMARDRFGEKPLFLHENADGLYFASEIKALLRVPGIATTVDPAAVWDYLAYRYVPAPATLFKGIYKLMPGTCATWQNGTLTQRRYWSAPDRGRSNANQPPGDAVPAFLGQLDEAVQLQMVSDVPFGAFLSGGLDSSTIVALMTRHNTNVRTFSVGFGEGGYSELAYANVVRATSAPTTTSSWWASTTSSRTCRSWSGTATRRFRSPPTSRSTCSAKEASKTVKMVLTGEGSDEILGGYPKHVYERFAQGYQQLPRSLRHGLIAPLAHSLPYGFRRAKTAVTNLNIEDWRERYVRWFGALNHAEREQLTVLRMKPRRPATSRPSTPIRTPARCGASSISTRRAGCPDNLLERGDRMTMAASIESRVPFLDHELADYVSSLPDSYRVKGLKTKWILREAGRSLIPDAILDRPKVGFRVPVNKWFQGPLKEYLCDHLKGRESKTRAYYDPQVLDRMLDDHIGGKQNHEKLLWALLNLEIWHRQYVHA